uniref:Retrovirus-related Pol polyprotein from transposon opus n=1 Tax=Tanacetum cinerariifolium TaxID=118510 RepID=A0A6L2M495_TANCI|nr:retrovirus-related Pol polyprotein from transposon opus [Tanacetum cinerariifolium]
MPMTVDGKIQTVLESYEDVFGIPVELPPQRIHDHKILLIGGALPVNIRSYRHPPTLKDVIEYMIKELLEAGVIKKSHSPFASPIVMVKKKDNSWRTCVDYKQLNKQTEYLGHVIYAQGVVIDPAKREAMVKEYQEKDKIGLKPDKNGKRVEAGKSLKQLQLKEEENPKKTKKEWPKTHTQRAGSPRSAGYYRRFIKVFSMIDRPLTQLLKKEAYEWNSAAQSAFGALKQASFEIA